MTIICSNFPSTICSSCVNNPKYISENMHTDLSVTHWRHREIVEYNLHFPVKIEAKKVLTCMLSLKTLGREIKYTLGISNRGNLIQGIVIKMLEGLEKQKRGGGGREEQTGSGSGTRA